jgi:murein DD-endopeptidase MepM/ murein hydrolase activator NlpD
MPSTSRTAATAVLAALAALAVLMFLVPGPASASGSVTNTGVWPLLPRPEVVAGFDPPAENWDAGHRGVDLLGTSGQTVRAAKSGRISYAGRLAGRGIVVVAHGDTRTTYQPVAATVHVGDEVIAGQKIGVLQSFGSHCWPRTCLHWGLIRGETYLDPLTLVGAGPVRLLPFYRGLGQLVGALIVGQSVTQSVTQPGPPHGLLSARPGGVPGGRPAAVGLW